MDYAKRKIKAAISKSAKKITFKFWAHIKLIDHYDFKEDADVIRPKILPDSPEVNQYVEYLKGLNFPPIMREKGDTGPRKLFYSENRRILFETHLLVAGSHLKAKHTFLPEVARPLGFSVLKTLGFGSLIVTYRNCPNNCPLAYWVEDDEFPPLFQRRQNKLT